MIAGAILAALLSAQPVATSTTAPELAGLTLELYRGLEQCSEDLDICEALRHGAERKLRVRTATAAAELVAPWERAEEQASMLGWIVLIVIAALGAGAAGYGIRAAED